MDDHLSHITEYLEKLHRDEKEGLLMVKAVLAKMILDKGYASTTDPSLLLTDFRVVSILEWWTKEPVPTPMWEDRLPSESDKIVLADFLCNGPNLKNADPSLLGQTFQLEKGEIGQKQHGVFYTPRKLIHTLCDMLEIPTLEGKKILDPSCGAGFILCCWYERLICEYRQKGWSDEKAHRRILETQLFGMDVDPQAAWVTAVTLQLHHPIFVPATGIQTGDFLLGSNGLPTMDIVAGNPPYVGHKQLDRDYFQTLKARYAKVYYDKGDLAFCFFQRGLEILKNGGKLAYITSRYYLEAQNATGLRQYLTEHSLIRKILDYYGHRPMKEAKVDPAITFLEKTEEKQGTQRVKVRRYQRETMAFSPEYIVSESYLTPEGWTLLEPMEQVIVDKIKQKQHFLLQDIWSSRQGIITGLDKAFILDRIEAEEYPKACIKRWIKNRHVQAFHIKDTDKRLLHTDGISHLDGEKTIRDHMEPYQNRLQNRRECRKGIRPWYHLQWGRDPNFFEGEKIVYPYKSHANRFALDNKGSFYSADVYGFMVKPGTYHHHTNKSMVVLLNSALYEFYFKSFGKKLGGNLYEYYPNTVGRLAVPWMEKHLVAKLETFHDGMNADDPEIRKSNWKELNHWIFRFFGITDIEMEHLEHRKENRI